MADRSPSLRNAVGSICKCPVCGETVIGPAVYCSGACKQKAYRVRQKELRRTADKVRERFHGDWNHYAKTGESEYIDGKRIETDQEEGWDEPRMESLRKPREDKPGFVTYEPDQEETDD